MFRRSNATGGNRIPLWIGAIAWVMYTSCVPAMAVTDAELVGPDLVVRQVKITSLHDQAMSYFDEQRTLQSAAIKDYVQLRITDDSYISPPPPYPCVSLTDGQQFIGNWISAAPDGSGLRWHNDLIGTLTIPLDEVASITWRAAETTDTTPVESGTDTILMINGDALSGFVSALTDQGVALITEAGTDPVTIPFDRIASLTLANPVLPPTDFGSRVTLTDGTRVLADELRWSGDQASWLVTPPGESPIRVQTSIADLSRIDFGSGGYRLIDLSELPMRAQNDPGVFGLAIPVRVQGRTILAHAPATIIFDLPPGAERFAATAELDTTDAPIHIRAWADFHVVVSSDGAEPGRGHLTGVQPTTGMNVPILGRELVIRLEPGVNGPILDRLLLRDAVILLRLPPTGRTGDAGH